MPSDIGMPNFFKAAYCPISAFASAWVTASRGLPVRADTSCAIARSLFERSTSFVAKTSFEYAGLNSSSATPVAIDILVIIASVALICASVAWAELRRLPARTVCAAASSIALFAASPKATANPAIASPAGTAAFLIAN